MSRHEQTPPYKISDLALVATLSALGFDIIKMDKEERNRNVFYFEDTKELQDTIADFWQGDLRVEPQTVIASLKTIKSRIYNTI